MSNPPSAKRQRTDGSWCISGQNAADLRNAGSNYLKLLVSNNTAGVLLGKGGAYLRDLEVSSQCCVKLSPSKHFYPGTAGQRVVAIAGSEDGLEAAISAIVTACAEADRQYAEREGRPQDGKTHIQAAIPNTACGLVLGRKGAMVKQISEQTGVPIKIAQMAEATVDGERSVSFAGPVDSVIAAVSKVCKIIQQDATLGQFLETPAEGSGVPVARPSGTPWTPAPPPPAAGTPSVSPYLTTRKGDTGNMDDFPCAITLEVTDAEAAHIIGKGGAFLQSVCQDTGAKVQISKRGEYIPGTQNRSVSISGPMAGVHSAHAMVLERATMIQP
eukprot:TRINITY_DN109106_c0_g1_i1.p1 TRINITY_DN109106_c0_g1~~TRINITY_DN109106_c0_g1_i1.p1  ORF type:complete len:329 (+),score=47.43 TRINITY_DN109106_c0_g1_i1:30-1016(+)